MTAADDVPVGRQLRAAREARGLTLEDISRETRVVRDYLAAVEEGEYVRLPSKAYARGIIRSYAGCVELPADDLIARYDGVQASVVARDDRAEPRPARPSRLPWERGWWIVPLLLFVVLILSTLLFRDTTPEPERPRPLAEVKPATVSVPAVLPMRTSASGGAVGRPAPVPSPPVPDAVAGEHPSAAGMYLRLKADRDSGLTITIDGALTQRYELKAGDLIDWKAERSLSIDVETPGAVTAEFNGRPLTLPAGGGTPVHLELRPDIVQ